MKKTAARTILIALLVTVMLATLAIQALAADYTNVPDWGVGQYSNAAIPDRLDGWNAGDKITREEFAEVIYKAFGNLMKNIAPAPDTTFTDTKNPAVLWACAAQIIQGVGNNQFNPDALITRQDIAVMCMRTAMKETIPAYTIKEDGRYTIVFDDPPAFADENNISDYAKTAVHFMTAMDVIHGRGDGIFDPLANATLLETAVMVTNMAVEFGLIMETLNNTIVK